MKNSFRNFLITFVFLLPMIFFAHTGFSGDSLVKNSQAVLFSVIFSFMIYYPKYKTKIATFCLFLFIGMAIAFVLEAIEIADILASTGFGILIFLLITHLPELIKKGYLEKI